MRENHLNSDVVSDHFTAFFDFVAIGIVVVNGTGDIVAINPHALLNFGYPKEELIGQKLEILIPERFRKTHLHQRINFTEKPRSRPMGQGMELYGQRMDGTEFPVEICLSHYTSEGSDFIAAFIVDISKRKAIESDYEMQNIELENRVAQRTKDLEEAILQLEVSKREIESHLSFKEKLIDTAGVMIIATDVNGTIHLINPEAINKLGYNEDEIVGKESPVLFHEINEIDRKRKQLYDEYGIRAGSHFDVLVTMAGRDIHEEEQYTYIGKTGNSFPVSLTITALRDNTGDVTGYLGVAVDISERIKAEKKLERAEHLFLQLLENYPDGAISIIDHNYCFVYTGGELHKQLNADIGKLIGQKAFPFFPKQLREVILSMLGTVFEDKVHIAGFELPYPIEDDIYIMDAFPLIEEDGHPEYIGVIIKNISELKQAEKRLKEDLKIERDLNELKSRFLSMASHEFRTPLSTVLSSAYLIEKYTSESDQPKREKHLKRIVSSVNMLTDILEDFLNLGKIEEGKLEAKFSKFNLEELIITTIDEIKNNLKKNQRIKYFHEGIPLVWLDPSLVKHIILNLVSNASKFSAEGSSIEIKSRQDQGHIELSVKDNGIGISIEDQAHLMERFFRGMNAQNIQGTGLGLSIVSRYVEMMHGVIRYSSELDKGTEFVVEFDRTSS